MICNALGKGVLVMVDIHCHILPALDDGAADLDEALLMARIAADSGTKILVATPHFGSIGDEADPQAILSATKQLQAAVDALGLRLRILPGMELLCTSGLEQILEQKQYLTLAGSRYLLAEFYFDEALEAMDRMLAMIAARGLIPVIAHPERYGAVQADPDTVQQWIDTGYCIQLNAGSLLGNLGSRAQRTARFLAHNGLAHAVASDGHSPDHRPPSLIGARDYLEERVCVACAQDLLYDGPRLILEDRPFPQYI